MKIGLYFGSFNPVHVGHLLVADYMVEFTNLEKIWFVISPQNPFKNINILLDNNSRLELLNIAIEDNPNFKTCDIEFNLTRPSYTINTLDILTEKYPEHEFSIIMGGDCFAELNKWKDYQKILDNYDIYVYPRGKKINYLFPFERVTFVNDAPLFELSSSFIRQSIKDNKNLRYFLTDKVYNRIKEMKYYEF